MPLPCGIGVWCNASGGEQVADRRGGDDVIDFSEICAYPERVVVTYAYRACVAARQGAFTISSDIGRRSTAMQSTD